MRYQKFAHSRCRTRTESQSHWLQLPALQFLRSGDRDAAANKATHCKHSPRRSALRPTYAKDRLMDQIRSVNFHGDRTRQASVDEVLEWPMRWTDVAKFTRLPPIQARWRHEGKPKWRFPHYNEFSSTWRNRRRKIPTMRTEPANRLIGSFGSATRWIGNAMTARANVDGPVPWQSLLVEILALGAALFAH